MLDLEMSEKLSKDLRKAAGSLTPGEVRYVVQSYYTLQGYRIAAVAQTKELSKREEPHELIEWLFKNFDLLEKEIVKTMDVFSDSRLVGRWAKSIYGIGPVLSAGLISHIDISIANTVGKIWRFAGLDPTVKWEKKEKRPWNADLKVLTWKIGESFVKVSNYEDDYYGKVYQKRKEIEEEKNSNGAFSDQASRILSEKNFRRDTTAKQCYTAGILPPGHIHARAKRYAVKLFLSHWHHVAYFEKFGEEPPKPYSIGIQGHADFIPPPNWPME